MRAALGSERGSMLVEALVAASLLVILSLGFLAALDVAARSSGSNESRAVSASLAQDDIERMRALKVRDLVNLSASRTQVVDGITYTITSRAQWVDDVTGSTTCPSSGATQSDYLKVTSTVTWPFMGTTRPVKNESLVAVPLGTLDGSTGGLIMKIQDRNQNGVPGIPAAISGPQNANGTTDADGCIFWTSLLEGPYTISFNQSGWVDKSGTSAVSKAVTVQGGATNSVIFDYDRGAKLDASFDTQIAGVGQVSRARGITVANNGMPAPGTRFFTTASASTTISTNYTLFPFNDDYAVWAGACAAADPRLYGDTTALMTFTPAGARTVTLRTPSLNIRVMRGGAPYQNARVRISPMTPGCGSTFDAGTLTSNGNLTNPGQPYGDYQVCADDGTRKVQSATIQNRAAAGTGTLTMSIPTSGATGTCS